MSFDKAAIGREKPKKKVPEGKKVCSINQAMNLKKCAFFKSF